MKTTTLTASRSDVGATNKPDASTLDPNGTPTTRNVVVTAWRRRLIATAVSGLAALAASLGVVDPATADGLTPAKLVNAGWTCFTDPGAPRIVCSDPGHGRPTPNDPDAPPSYNFKIFDLDGTFTGTSHLVRADLYNGRSCPQTGASYFFIAPIGYYRCEHI
jgi:hypothetical protein